MPRHLLTTDDAEILKNVVLHSVATAFASIVCNIKNKSYIVIQIHKIPNGTKGKMCAITIYESIFTYNRISLNM